MPKVNSKKRNSASRGNPYEHAAAKTKAANNIFKMNTDMGQHVLKNPGVAQAIVDKADLKQSDVRRIDTLIYIIYLSYSKMFPANSVTYKGCTRGRPWIGKSYS